MKLFKKTLLATAILATSLNVFAEDIKLNQYDKLELQNKINLLEKDLENLKFQMGSNENFITKQTDDNLKAIGELRNKLNTFESIIHQLPNQSNFTQLESTFEKRLDDNQFNVLKRMDVTDSTFDFWGTLSGLFGVLITITLAALASLHFTSIKESEKKVKQLVVDAEKEQALALDKAVQKTIREANEAAQQWFNENAENKIEHYLSQVKKSIDGKITEIDETILSITKTSEEVKNYEIEAKKIKETLNKIFTDNYSKMISENKLSVSGHEQAATPEDKYNNLLKSANELYKNGKLTDSLSLIDIYLQNEKPKENDFNLLIMKTSILIQLKQNNEALAIILSMINHIDEKSSLSELMEKVKVYLLLTMLIMNLDDPSEAMKISDDYINFIKDKSNGLININEADKYSLSIILRNLGIFHSINKYHKKSEVLFKDTYNVLESITDKNEQIEWDTMEALSGHLNMIRNSDMGRALSHATELLSSSNKQVALASLTFITHNLNEMRQYKNTSEVYLNNITLVSLFDNILSDMCKLNGSIALYETSSDNALIIDTIRKLTEKYENTERKDKYKWLLELDDFIKKINDDENHALSA